jgi:hypothetical protein
MRVIVSVETEAQVSSNPRWFSSDDFDSAGKRPKPSSLLIKLNRYRFLLSICRNLVGLVECEIMAAS